jgi:hypothetical protein
MVTAINATDKPAGLHLAVKAEGTVAFSVDTVCLMRCFTFCRSVS